MSYFCMRAPAADGHAAAQMPAGLGAGSRQVQPPLAHPASCSIPAGSTSHPWRGHGARPHPRPSIRHHQQRNLIPPGKDDPLCPQKEPWGHEAPTTKPGTPAPIALRGGTRIPALGTQIAGGWQGGLALTEYLRGRSSLCRRWARIRPERGAGLLGFTVDFPCASSGRAGNLLRAKINSAAWQGCKRPAPIPHGWRWVRSTLLGADHR